jgi:hypothetical protein
MATAKSARALAKGKAGKGHKSCSASASFCTAAEARTPSQMETNSSAPEGLQRHKRQKKEIDAGKPPVAESLTKWKLSLQEEISPSSFFSHRLAGHVRLACATCLCSSMLHKPEQLFPHPTWLMYVT